MTAQDVCPLCHWPRHDREPCGDESRTTPGDPWRHDVAAALRAASVRGPRGRACFDRLLARCRPRSSDRSPDPDVAAVEQAVRTRDAGERGARRADGVVAMALARLAAGEFGRLVIVEIAPDGVTTCEIVGDGTGLAQRGCRPVPESWAELIDDADPEDRDFFLAGGVGVDPAEARRDPAVVLALATGILESASVRRDDPDTEYLVLRRVTGWRVIELLVRGLRERVQPTGDVVLRRAQPAVSELVDGWCATAPLRHGYELAVAAVDPAGGAVSVAARPLFGAGAAVPLHGELRAQIEIARPDGRAGPVLLPVLIATAAPIRSRPLLVAGRAELPEQGPVTVEVILRRPGDLEFVPLRPNDPAAADVPVTVSPVRWPDVVGDLSGHLAFDVAVAVETGGEHDAVTARLDLARTITHGLRLHDGDAPGVVRLALIRYDEHPTRTGPRARQPACHVHPFGSPDDALATLGTWRPSDVDNPYGAAVEDALRGAARLEWRPGSLRSLVVIGSRPPGVPSLGRNFGAQCPDGIVWGDELGILRGRLSVRCFAVVDEPSWVITPVYRAPVDRTKQAWQDIAADGRYAPDSVPTLVRKLVPGSAAGTPLAVPVAGAGRG